MVEACDYSCHLCRLGIIIILNFNFLNLKIPSVLLLGRVALVAQRPIVVKLFRGRSVGRSVCRSVCLSSALWKNGGSDQDAVWHRRSDGFRDEAGSGVWGSVHGKGYF